MTRERDDDGKLPLSKAPPVDEDVRRELEFHIELRTREYQERGMSADDARAAAQRDFGDRSAIESECREIEQRRRTANRRSRRLEELAQDLKLGARVLRKSPGFAIAAVLTIALGIGANTAVFSIINSVILRPLPYEEPSRLVVVAEQHDNGNPSDLPWPNLVDIRDQVSAFDAVAAYGASMATVLDAGPARRTRVASVSDGFFRVFPMLPERGRLTLPDDHRLGASPVALVSHEFWRDQLGSPTSLDDIRIRLDRQYQVVGVLPRGFDFPRGAQVWMPLELDDPGRSRTAHNWEAVGRLASGATPEGAQREVDALFARLHPIHYPDFDASGGVVEPLQATLTAGTRKPLLLLMGASALLLLGACANLASAMLARGIDVAVRTALGATRQRIVRQLLTESALMAMLGCAAGLALAAGLLRALELLAPATIGMDRVTIDAWVLGFAIVVTAVTAVLFGLLPALRLVESDPSSMLRHSRGTPTKGRVLAWNLLVVAEVAIAVVLISGATLLSRSFAKVMDRELGFDPDRVLAVGVDLPRVTYTTPSQVPQFHERLYETLTSTPGVVAAGFANVMPMGGNGPSGAIEVDGKPHLPQGPFTGYGIYRVVGGDFFGAMRMPILRGRAFGPSDDASAPPVVIVNEAMAEREWPGEDPIGKRLRPYGMDRGDGEPWATVVGVVGNVRSANLTDDFRATAYYPHRQRPAGRALTTTWAVRSSLDADALTSSVRAAVERVDPQVPLEIRPAERLVSARVADRRFTMLVISGFAVIALFLAIIGIYGVVSYTVAQRTREIGIRLALGASPGAMLRMVVGAAMRTVVPGLALGALLTFAASGTLRSMLYEMSPLEPVSMLGAVGVLAIAALASCVVPGVRATRVDPIVSMRAE